MLEERQKSVGELQKLLLDRAGLAFTGIHVRILEDKMAMRLHATGCATVWDYLDLLRSPDEFQNLLDILTVGETSFFRNEPQFQAFESRVLPELVRERLADPGGTPWLKFWCAGCSTGEEPYTLALILRETLPDFGRWRISLLATDINRVHLRKAEAAVYPSRALQKIPPHYVEKYFEISRDGGGVLKDEIRDMVVFRHHNLADPFFDDPGMSALDAVFCRNVTIYFDLAVLKRVIGNFARALRQDGILFLGHSETLWGISERFTPIHADQAFIYRNRPLTRSESPFPFEIETPSPIHPEREFVSERSEPVRDDSLMEASDADYTEAFAAYARKDYDKALLSIAASQRAGRLDSEALYLQSTILADQGADEDALTCAFRILDRDPLHVRARFLAGVLLGRLRRYEEAADMFGKILFINPDLAVCHFHLGNVLRLLNRADKAGKSYLNCKKLLATASADEKLELSEEMVAGELLQAVDRALECTRI